MEFKFKEKKEALNWDQVSACDIQHIVQNNDIGQLENLLANLTNTKLQREDLVKFGDKNLIKLFKVGQLSLESLLFQQQYSEVVVQHTYAAYATDLEKCKPLEQAARQTRQAFVNLQADLKLKKQTLNAYQDLLSTPLGKAQVFKCVLCFKYFQDNSYLQEHYKRRHLEYYNSERNQRMENIGQNLLDTRDLKQDAEKRQRDFVETIKSDIFDRYSSNLVNVQEQLQAVKNETQVMNQKQLQSQVTSQEGLKTAMQKVALYEENITKFELEMQKSNRNQINVISDEVKRELLKLQQLQEVKEEQLKKEALRLQTEHEKKEITLKQQIKREITEILTKEHNTKLDQVQTQLSAKDEALKQALVASKQQAAQADRVRLEDQRALELIRQNTIKTEAEKSEVIAAKKKSDQKTQELAAEITKMTSQMEDLKQKQEMKGDSVSQEKMEQWMADVKAKYQKELDEQKKQLEAANKKQLEEQQRSDQLAKKLELIETSLGKKIEIETIRQLVTEVKTYDNKIELAQKLKSLMVEKDYMEFIQKLENDEKNRKEEESGQALAMLKNVQKQLEAKIIPMLQQVQDAKSSEKKAEVLGKLKLWIAGQDFKQLVKKLENEKTYTESLSSKILLMEDQIKNQFQQEEQANITVILEKVKNAITFEQKKEFFPQLKLLIPDLDYKELVQKLESEQQKRLEDEKRQAKLEQERLRKAEEKKKVPSKKNEGHSAGTIVDDNDSDEQPSAQKAKDSARKANPTLIEVETKVNPKIEEPKTKISEDQPKIEPGQQKLQEQKRMDDQVERKKSQTIETEKTKTAEVMVGPSITSAGGTIIPVLDLSTISSKGKKDAARIVEKEKEYLKEQIKIPASMATIQSPKEEVAKGEVAQPTQARLKSKEVKSEDRQTQEFTKVAIKTDSKRKEPEQEKKEETKQKPDLTLSLGNLSEILKQGNPTDKSDFSKTIVHSPEFKKVIEPKHRSPIRTESSYDNDFD